MTIDPITLEVLWNRLIAVVNEQAAGLMRTSFTTVVRESGDLSAGVFDRRGNMIAQAVTGTPGHINSMATCIHHFLPGIIFGALAEVLPNRVMAEGAANIWATQITGRRAEGGLPWTYVWFSCGGTGARPTSDGLHTTAFPSGVMGVHVETIETQAPVIVHRREISRDSVPSPTKRNPCAIRRCATAPQRRVGAAHARCYPQRAQARWWLLAVDSSDRLAAPKGKPFRHDFLSDDGVNTTVNGFATETAANTQGKAQEHVLGMGSVAHCVTTLPSSHYRPSTRSRKFLKGCARIGRWRDVAAAAAAPQEARCPPAPPRSPSRSPRPSTRC
jgi:hypothetical protein